MTDILILVCLAVHVLACIVVGLLMASGLLKTRLSCLPIMAFVPVFGAVALLFHERALRSDARPCDDFELEELRVNDAVYKSIVVEPAAQASEAVPLREALLVNDPATRRRLIMDVLYDDASAQPHALRAARSNDDAEVVHYATTALVELQKTYDDRMQRARAACQADPHDVEAARNLASVLGAYIESGLLEGMMLTSTRAEYARVLDALLALVSRDGEEALGVCWQAFLNAQARGEVGDMERTAERAVAVWPQREDGYLMRLHTAVAREDRAGIDRALETLQRGDVRVTARGRRDISYWRRDDHAKD